MSHAGDWGFRKDARDGAGCRSSAYRSTAIVLGYGAVGRYVAGVLAALGTRVIAVRRSAAPGGAAEGAAAEVHPPAALHALLPRATALIIAAPLTAETRGVVDAAALARLPDHASVVNIGRAEIVDEGAIWAEVRCHTIHME